MEKKLGKIQRFDVGYGGYQGAMVGVSFSLSGEGWGTDDFKGWWSPSTTSSERTNWSERERGDQFDNVMRFIDRILHEAKKSKTQDLVGVPVEVTFNNLTLMSWRVLTEVL